MITTACAAWLLLSMWCVCAFGQPVSHCDGREYYPKQCAALAAAERALEAERRWEPSQKPNDIVQARLDGSLIVVSYTYGQRKVIVLYDQYKPGEYALPAENRAIVLSALKAALPTYLSEGAGVKNITVVGHTDLIATKGGSFDVDGYCGRLTSIRTQTIASVLYAGI